jgi:hypothetical protein
MKTVMVVPSYWTGPDGKGGWEDALAASRDGWPAWTVYDHPTSLEEEGTLNRCLRSLSQMREQPREVVVIAASTTPEWAEDVEQRVGALLSGLPNVRLFSHSHLRIVQAQMGSVASVLSLNNYSDIRNLCLFLPHLLGGDLAILIDDDEMLEDPEFFARCKEFMGEKIADIEDFDTVNLSSPLGRDERVLAKAGYYINPDNGWQVGPPDALWKKTWGQSQAMGEAFDRLIGEQPRMKETPLAFGGCMVVHRELFEIPFDSGVPRGEDLDWVLNARLQGYRTWFDNHLWIRHAAPSKPHPDWLQLRIDGRRFFYSREKIRSFQVNPASLSPYPGCFLGDDLEQRLELACKQMGEEQALNTPAVATRCEDPKQRMDKLAERWGRLISETSAPQAKQDLCALVWSRS